MSSKAEKRRRARARQETRRRQRRWRFIGLGLIAVLLGAAGYYFLTPSSEVRTFPSQGNQHIEGPGAFHLPYNSRPPTSGPHTPYLAAWGVHTEPIPDEVQVHNLEDGGVLVQYSCDCPEIVSELERLVGEYDEQVILAPYPAMPHRIALTAWGRMAVLDTVDEGTIRDFIETYRGVDHHPSRIR